MKKCILCQADSPFYLRADLLKKDCDYFCCENCGLVFLDPDDFLSAQEEGERYELHENKIEDPGFKKFVTPMLELIQNRTQSDQSGLDFGCGPGPIIAHELMKKNYQINCYDPFFADDKSLLSKKYDFVFANEVAEHFHKPIENFELFKSLLKAGGFLFIGTQLLPKTKKAFSDWYYRRDPTHTCFYSEQSVRHIAEQMGWGVEIHPPRNIVFKA